MASQVKYIDENDKKKKQPSIYLDPNKGISKHYMHDNLKSMGSVWLDQNEQNGKQWQTFSTREKCFAPTQW